MPNYQPVGLSSNDSQETGFQNEMLTRVGLEGGYYNWLRAVKSVPLQLQMGLWSDSPLSHELDGERWICEYPCEYRSNISPLLGRGRTLWNLDKQPIGFTIEL